MKILFVCYIVVIFLSFLNYVLSVYNRKLAEKLVRKLKIQKQIYDQEVAERLKKLILDSKIIGYN
jgi:hypothetical protein